MSDDLQYKVTLDLTAKSESLFTDLAAAHLRERGFNVTAPHDKWETIGDFLRRLGIHSQTLTRKLRPWPGRPNVVVHRARKRIIAVLSNKDFDAYCVANK